MKFNKETDAGVRNALAEVISYRMEYLNRIAVLKSHLNIFLSILVKILEKS